MADDGLDRADYKLAVVIVSFRKKGIRNRFRLLGY